MKKKKKGALTPSPLNSEYKDRYNPWRKKITSTFFSAGRAKLPLIIALFVVRPLAKYTKLKFFGCLHFYLVARKQGHLHGEIMETLKGEWI